MITFVRATSYTEGCPRPRYWYCAVTYDHVDTHLCCKQPPTNSGRLSYEFRCVPELQDMSKSPKHNTFRCWYPDCLTFGNPIWGIYGELGGDRYEIEWRLGEAKAE